MAAPQPGAKVAKDLGIYLGQLYGWIKAGKVVNHKVGGYPEGKGVEVDPDEARAVWMTTKKKGPRAPKAERIKAAPRGRKGADGEVVAETKAKRLRAGTIVSYENGRSSGASVESKVARPRYTVAQVLGSTGKLTYMDDGDHRRHYEGTQIDNLVFGTERLSRMMARGVARVEHPGPVLGMIMLSFIMDERLDLAESLEKWVTDNGLEVVIPELMELDDRDDEPEPVRGALVGAEDEEGE